MGLRPIKRNEDAVGRSSGINGLDRVFNRAAYANFRNLVLGKVQNPPECWTA